ncbi:hypothetical protein JCM3775_003490 [Rhodotorula graminis]
MQTCPPSPSGDGAIGIRWDDVLAVASRSNVAAAPSSHRSDARTPPPSTSPNLYSKADFPTPTSLAAPSPMARTSSQVSVPPSPFEAALATLKSPPRRTRASRKRTSAASVNSDTSSSSTAPAFVNPAAPTAWTGPGFPSVLLRSASDSSCPTRASLAPLSDLSVAVTSAPLHPSPFLSDTSSAVAEASTSACRADDIIVDSPSRKRKKTTKKPDGYIPRPPNSFFLYRSARLKELSAARDESDSSKPQQAELSRHIAAMWKAESVEVREMYARRAAEEKEAHAQRYPDYAFRPKPARRSSAKAKLEHSLDDGASTSMHAAVEGSTWSTSDAWTGLVGANPLGELLPAIQFSGFGSPISPSSAYAGFPTTPSTATSSHFESVFLPPSTAASEAWTTFRSAPLVWTDAPATSSSMASLDPALFTDFCNPPQSAPAGLSGFDHVLTPPPSTTAYFAPLPVVAESTLLPPPPLTYEDLLASFPFSEAAASSPFDPSLLGTSSSSDEPALALPALPEPDNSACDVQVPQHESLSIPPAGYGMSPDSFEAFFQTFAANCPSP